MDTRNQEHPPRCVWMDAGVVAYKLCDREFRCEECPFDAIMRHPVFENLETIHGERIPSLTPNQTIERFFAAFEPVQFPGDRMYVPGHLWIRTDSPDSATIGIDHIAASLLGPFVNVVLPRQPMHLAVHSPCCWLVHHEGTISLSSPVDGIVLAYNGQLASQPNLLTEKPYSTGWILKAHVDAARKKEKTQRSASENSFYSARELETLKGQFATLVQPRPGIGPSALDGGVPVQSPLEMMGPAAFALIARLFLT